MPLQVWRMLQKPFCGNQMNLATLINPRSTSPWIEAVKCLMHFRCFISKCFHPFAIEVSKNSFIPSISDYTLHHQISLQITDKSKGEISFAANIIFCNVFKSKGMVLKDYVY